MKRLLLLLLLPALLGLAGCNTIAGAGQDIETGGKSISDTAKDVQRDL